MMFPYVIGILDNNPVFVIIFEVQRSKKTLNIYFTLTKSQNNKTVDLAKDRIPVGEKNFIGYKNNFLENLPDPGFKPVTKIKKFLLYI